MILFVVPANAVNAGTVEADSRFNSTSVDALPTYETPYYIIHTDLDADAVREATIHMTKMAEEYHQRTLEFSGVIRTKLPFYLFRTQSDYYAAGGIRGTAGLFNGKSLLAVAGEHLTARTWQVVQHEGFHQFAAAVIGGDLPTWVNEGLAEYFGTAVFTGDGFQTGVIPPWRLVRLKAEMARPHGLHSVADLMELSLDQWNGEMNVANYDQAWSMVQFLAHGDDGKYQKPFTQFMLALNKGQNWRQAWKDSFGNTEGFEDRWREYWKSQNEDPTADLYARATTATLTSFIGRAIEQRQTFGSFDLFTQAARDKTLRCSQANQLPPSLIESALSDVQHRTDKGYTWSLVPPSRTTGGLQIVCVLPDGRKWIGRFVLRGTTVEAVSVDAVDPRQARDRRGGPPSGTPSAG
jgi:Protein of unknown function (DUF1570)